MRTTLDLPDPLFREVKTRAVQQGVTLKELLSRYIEAGLREPASAPFNPSGNPGFLPVAFKRVPGAPLVPARSNAELFAILGQQDVAESRRAMGLAQPTS